MENYFGVSNVKPTLTLFAPILRNFAPMFMKDISLSFSFVVLCLVSRLYRSQNESERVSLFSGICCIKLFLKCMLDRIHL